MYGKPRPIHVTGISLSRQSATFHIYAIVGAEIYACTDDGAIKSYSADFVDREGYPPVIYCDPLDRLARLDPATYPGGLRRIAYHDYQFVFVDANGSLYAFEPQTGRLRTTFIGSRFKEPVVDRWTQRRLLVTPDAPTVYEVLSEGTTLAKFARLADARPSYDATGILASYLVAEDQQKRHYHAVAADSNGLVFVVNTNAGKLMLFDADLALARVYDLPAMKRDVAYSLVFDESLKIMYLFGGSRLYACSVRGEILGR